MDLLSLSLQRRRLRDGVAEALPTVGDASASACDADDLALDLDVGQSSIGVPSASACDADDLALDFDLDVGQSSIGVPSSVALVAAAAELKEATRPLAETHVEKVIDGWTKRKWTNKKTGVVTHMWTKHIDGKRVISSKPQMPISKGEAISRGRLKRISNISQSIQYGTARQAIVLAQECCLASRIKIVKAPRHTAPQQAGPFLRSALAKLGTVRSNLQSRIVPTAVGPGRHFTEHEVLAISCESASTSYMDKAR